MSYLAMPVERMGREYDVVVVGSGYGGSIAASRMSRAGLRVCLLERGEEWRPGDFPDNPAEGLREIQFDAPDRRAGSRTGLFDFHVNRDISVLVGCGLGGTSLINANVCLPPDDRVFQDPAWPEGFRAHLGNGFEKSVDRVREMLRPTAFPDGGEVPAKLAALEASAKHMGGRFYRTPIAVTFGDGVNHVGVEQRACNLCGDCVSGCNHGAKNTLAMNYLPDARNHGAEIYTRAAVRSVERKGDRWLVHFDVVDPGPRRFGAPSMFVAARSVFLAAGSLGSTEILLRSRERGLPLSDRLGERFTGNGDVLGFAYNADVPVNGIGVADLPGRTGPGPCITGVIDLRDRDPWERGMIIEEGVIPALLGPMLPAVLALASRAVGRDTDSGFRDYAMEKLREAQALVPGGSTGALGNTQTYLVMTHDDSAGRIELREDRARIEWPGVGKQEIFEEVDRNLLEATRAIGGTFLKNPAWTERLGNSLVTVHPLGGCPMADTAEDGVVDAVGRVFAGASGQEVHDGLYVCDGAVLPRSVGVNPLLTISAVAEQICAAAAAEHGREISYDLPSRPVGAPPEPAVGVRFTETMRGYASAEGSDFEEGYRLGEEAGSPLEFTVTVVSDDVDDMVTNPHHRATLYGTVEAPALSPRPLTTTGGHFELLTVDSEEVRGRRMVYRMGLASEEGDRFFLEGFKTIRDDEGFDLWSDTTTLYVTVREGDDETGEVVLRGILRIRPADFAKQLRTFRITDAGSLRARVEAAARFGRFFAGALHETYGGVFARRSSFDPEAPPRRRRELRSEPPEVHFLEADDGVSLRLTRHQAGDATPVLLAHGVGMSSFAFGLDTIETNLLEFLQERGHDVWLLDHRSSIDLPSSESASSTADVARHDLPAALARIREVTGADAVDVVAQGSGATASLMALLDGVDGVRSLVCSQAALHVRTPRTTRLKAGLHLPRVLRALGVDSLSTFAEGGKGWSSKVFDAGLRMVPVESEEWCRSEVCRRVTFMYGPLFEHDQVNAPTHDVLHELFGVANIHTFEELSRMVRKGEVVDADGASYVRDLDRLSMPVTFIHGEENASYLPEGTAETVEVLAKANGSGLYEQHVIADYGATDCLIGKNAARDVYPHVAEHLERAARA